MVLVCVRFPLKQTAEMGFFFHSLVFQKKKIIKKELTLESLVKNILYMEVIEIKNNSETKLKFLNKTQKHPFRSLKVIRNPQAGKVKCIYKKGKGTKFPFQWNFCFLRILYLTKMERTQRIRKMEPKVRFCSSWDAQKIRPSNWIKNSNTARQGGHPNEPNWPPKMTLITSQHLRWCHKRGNHLGPQRDPSECNWYKERSLSQERPVSFHHIISKPKHKVMQEWENKQPAADKSASASICTSQSS